MNARLTFSAILFIVLSLSLALAADQPHRCAACGKPITEGEWVRVDSKYYHPNHFTCAACGQPIGAGHFYAHEGTYYDSACYVERVLPKCAYCGEPVGSAWVTYGGKPYHRECYENHIALRCSMCGEIIEGPYLTDIWGNSYHERHKNEPRCFSCGRLISPASNGGETYADGRTICGLCRTDVIKKPNDAKEIMRQVQATLATLGIEIDRDNLPLHLVGRDRLAEVSLEPRGDLVLEAYTYFEKESWLLGLVTERKFNIYVLYGLPRMEYTAVIAHELMHVWLGLKAPMYQDNAMVEGTCNYASYLVLKQIGSDDANRRIEEMTNSPDAIYGEGFRKVTAEVNRTGLSAWLDYLNDNTKPPW
jgi:DNA-directed RNA polymerase subunit N (RpoN/RPB10)